MTIGDVTGRPLRVCLVSYEFPPIVGGEASYTYNLASLLAERGHEVSLILPYRGRGNQYTAIPGSTITAVKFLRLPTLKVGTFMVAAKRVLRRRVDEGRVDLVHYTFDYPSLPVSERDLGVPTVVTVHHLHLVEALGVRRAKGCSLGTVQSFGVGAFITRMEKTLIESANLLICVSEFTKNTLSSYAGLADNRALVIPNGIDVDEFNGSFGRGDLRKRLGLGSRRIVLFVGRLGPSKGLEYLIQAFKTIKEEFDSTCLLLVGDGPTRYHSKLRHLANSLGIEGDVLFAGRLGRADLPEAYASSEVLVLPSLMEGFGLTLLEAMASGKPCVASNVGAIPEILMPRRAGILVSPGDAEELAQGIRRILVNPQEAVQMGERGRAFAGQKYTVQEMVRKTEAAYRRVLKRP